MLLHQLRETAQQRTAYYQSEQVRKFNESHRKPRKYKEGDLVLIRYECPATGGSRKMEFRFRGPYMINKVLNCDRYQITDTPTTQITQKAFNSVYTAENIKLSGDRQEIEGECIEVENDEETERECIEVENDDED